MDASSRVPSVIELSSGHVFAAGSVRAVTPLERARIRGAFELFRFTLIGVGFSIDIDSLDFSSTATYAGTRIEDLKMKHEALRQEAINKLLGIELPTGLKVEDLELARQWFDNVMDVNPTYLAKEDYKLAVKLYGMLGIRVPDNIANVA